MTPLLKKICTLLFLGFNACAITEAELEAEHAGYVQMLRLYQAEQNLTEADIQERANTEILSTGYTCLELGIDEAFGMQYLKFYTKKTGKDFQDILKGCRQQQREASEEEKAIGGTPYYDPFEQYRRDTPLPRNREDGRIHEKNLHPLVFGRSPRGKYIHDYSL